MKCRVTLVRENLELPQIVAKTARAKYLNTTVLYHYELEVPDDHTPEKIAELLRSEGLIFERIIVHPSVKEADLDEIFRRTDTGIYDLPTCQWM